MIDITEWSLSWLILFFLLSIIKASLSLDMTKHNCELVEKHIQNGNCLIETKDTIPYHQETTSNRSLEMWMPFKEKIKIKSIEMNFLFTWSTLLFDDVVVEFDDCFLLLVDIPSPLSVDAIDVEVDIRSRGVGVLTSLLLLWSFKLRRRTGFLRIFLIINIK